MSAEIIAGLLDDMEEYYGAFDYFPLYQLGWSLNDRPADDRAEARTWPSRRTTSSLLVTDQGRVGALADRPGQARPLEPGTPLEFDLDPDGPTDSRCRSSSRIRPTASRRRV